MGTIRRSAAKLHPFIGNMRVIIIKRTPQRLYVEMLNLIQSKKHTDGKSPGRQDHCRILSNEGPGAPRPCSCRYAHQRPSVYRVATPFWERFLWIFP